MILRVIKRCLAALTAGVALFVATWLVLGNTASPKVEATGPDGTGQFPLFVDGNSLPITGTIRVLCYQTAADVGPVADREFAEVMSGVVELPAGCNYLAALHLKHQQASGKPGHGPAYWVYDATSWSPGSTTPLSATGIVTLSANRPLVLFNVVASLAWKPAPGSPYLAELRQGLRDASAYLYDLTDGQMAFGPLTIHTAGRNWDGADLRFLAANDYRPSAFVGGIVPTRTAYTNSHFKPGATYYGRYWDGVEASNSITGTWAHTDAYRTIIHEWAHYALFLYDEYQQNGKETYCICDDLPNVTPDDPPLCLYDSFPGFTSTLAASAMAFHYEDKASELWSRTVHGTPSNCTNTHQWQYHGQSDWETLANWHNIQNLPPGVPPLTYSAALDPGPEPGLAADLFGRLPGYRIYLPVISAEGSPAPSIFEPILELAIEGSLGPTETLPSQVYILKGAGQRTPQRILHQGKVTGLPEPASSLLGKMKLLGIEKGDQVRIFVDRYETITTNGEHFSYLDSLSEADLNSGSIQAKAQKEDVDLLFSLDAEYEMSGPWVTTMTVVLTSENSLSFTPEAQLCTMDAAIGCHQAWQKEMSGGPKTWFATFTPLASSDELPLYGVVRAVVNPGQEKRQRERICWYQTAGSVPPAHDDGGAPLRDGPVMVDAIEPIIGTPNRTMVMAACSHDALLAELPSVEDIVRGIIETPLDLDIIQPPTAQPRCPQGNLSSPVRVTLFYNEDTIAQLKRTLPSGSFNEATDLQILHFERTINDNQVIRAWKPVNISGRSTALNWISTEPVCEDGIYAIGWHAR